MCRNGGRHSSVPATMSEPVAYLNGRLLPAHQAALSIVDAGFVLGGDSHRAASHLRRAVVSHAAASQATAAFARHLRHRAGNWRR